MSIRHCHLCSRQHIVHLNLKLDLSKSDCSLNSKDTPIQQSLDSSNKLDGLNHMFHSRRLAHLYSQDSTGCSADRSIQLQYHISLSIRLDSMCSHHRMFLAKWLAHLHKLAHSFSHYIDSLTKVSSLHNLPMLRVRYRKFLLSLWLHLSIREYI